MEEIYKDIPGFEGRYRVSNHGNIKSLRYKEWQDLVLPTGTGYKTIHLLGKIFCVHRLVVMAFIGPIPKGYEVNHLDCDKTNNHVSNLEICTPSENMQHAFKMGVCINPVLNGEKNGMSHLKTEDILKMRELFDNGIKVPEIKKKHFRHLHRETIRHIVKRIRWKHI